MKSFFVLVSVLLSVAAIVVSVMSLRRCEI